MMMKTSDDEEASEDEENSTENDPKDENEDTPAKKTVNLIFFPDLKTPQQTAENSLAIAVQGLLTTGGPDPVGTPFKWS